jgi:Spy/CpxP family protein refolding chaperone
MLRNFAIAFTTVAALMVAANLQAQGQGRGPGGGRGMGGGMMGGQGGGTLMLLQNAEVQKEIDLVADQKEKLTAIAKELQDARPANRGNMTDEERTKMREGMQKIQKKAEAVLLPHQLERVKQIQLQQQLAMMPGMALASEEVAKTLELTDDQKAKVKTLNDDAMKAMRDMFTPGQRPDRTKMQEARTETEKKLMDILTTDQKAKLEKLKGPKFDTSTLRGGPGGGNRGNRGGNNAGPVN